MCEGDEPSMRIQGVGARPNAMRRQPLDRACAALWWGGEGVTGGSSRPVRSAGRVVRVDSDRLYVVFDQWRRAQIMVPVAMAELVQALGAVAQKLEGMEISALIRAGALTDADVRPQDWRRLAGVRARAA